jgi:RNA polymerase sigma factor (sigma-70 family)
MFLFLNTVAMTDAELQRDDHQLLRDYVDRRSGSAFAELVRRHVDAVYSSAVRRVNGDRALAEDIVQCVFTDLARKAAQMPPGTVPGGWLHRHTGFVASHHIDRERRRRAREQQAVAMNALTDATGDPAWERTAPLLDEALDALPNDDRDAIVLRFFEKRDFRAVGQALGVSDDTAQKRVSRALEKLRGLLTRRGVTSTGAALSAIMLANTVTQAPAALVTALPGRALAGAATTGGSLASALSGLSLAARWKLAALAALIAVAGATPFLIERATRSPAPLQATAASETKAVPPPAVSQASPASPVVQPAPAPPTTADLIASAAAALRGGAQSFSAMNKAMSLLTQISTKSEAEAAEPLSLIAAVPDTQARSLLYKYFINHWADSDPEGALSFALTKLPGEQQLSTAEGILSAWAARNPEDVVVWDTKGRHNVLPRPNDALVAAFFRARASTDLPRAFRQLSEIYNPNQRAQALRGIMETAMTPQARDRIIETAATLKDDEIRVQTRRAVVETWALQNPAEAAAWIDKVEPAWERPSLMDSLGLVWLHRKPEAAAKWWLEREPGPDTLVKIINVWAQKDVHAAAKWLDSQPIGPQSDTARMTFARQVAEREPEIALQWASTVSDETMRRSATEHILKSWRARNPAAAARYEAKTP